MASRYLWSRRRGIGFHLASERFNPEKYVRDSHTGLRFKREGC